MKPIIKPLEQQFADAWEALDKVICDVEPVNTRMSLERYDTDMIDIQLMATRAEMVAKVLRTLSNERAANRQEFIEALQDEAEKRVNKEDLYMTRGNQYPRKP